MTEENNTSLVEDLTPATGPINIEILLDAIENYISKHAILPDGASTAIAFWCLATFNINCFRVFPKLVIFSPEKRCGKSTVLDLIEAFSCRALMTSNMTSATIFRVIQSDQPTLIIDEADTFIVGCSGEMVGIINSGHAKSRAFVMRCAPDTNKVEKFSTWSPMVLASIGELQTTIMDRSVIIPIRRKTIGETVIRLPIELSSKSVLERQKLLKWSLDNADIIKNNIVEPPDLGNDRAIDNWLPLFTVASQVSDLWLKKCETAYNLLNSASVEPDIATLLLADIRDIFVSHNAVKITSADLVKELTLPKDKPWCEVKHGRPLTQNGLAVMLKKYDISPKSIRHNGSTAHRGYELNQLQDTFDRYLPPLP